MNADIRKLPSRDVDMVEVTFRSGAAPLSGRLFRPARPARAIAVLNGATGVPQSFYRHFAHWLAESRGIACLTFDYRDFAASARGPVRASPATMVDWGLHDQQAARDWARQAMPDLPLWVIGHSLGGFMLPFQRGLDAIARVVTVASGPVNVHDHPWPYRAVAAAFWYGPAPVLTRALGYLPGRRLGAGADLPGGVYWQWRRWCTAPGFFSADLGGALPYPDWAGVTAPVKLVAVADDDLVPPAAVWRLSHFYAEAPKRQLVLKPEDFGGRKIGHIGAFRQGNTRIWDAIVE